MGKDKDITVNISSTAKGWHELSITQQEQLKLKNKQLSECDKIIKTLSNKVEFLLGVAVALTTTVLTLLIFK